MQHQQVYILLRWVDCCKFLVVEVECDRMMDSGRHAKHMLLEESKMQRTYSRPWRMQRRPVSFPSLDLSRKPRRRGTRRTASRQQCAMIAKESFEKKSTTPQISKRAHRTIDWAIFMHFLGIVFKLFPPTGPNWGVDLLGVMALASSIYNKKEDNY